MTSAADLPLPDLEQASDSFPVDTVVDVEAADNSGLIPAMAELLIDLYRKRLAREQAQHHDEPQGKEAVP